MVSRMVTDVAHVDLELFSGHRNTHTHTHTHTHTPDRPTALPEPLVGKDVSVKTETINPGTS